MSRRTAAKVPGTEQKFVSSYTESYAAGYRLRATTALGLIGGPDAKRALEEASRMTLRKDVVTAVKSTLSKMK